MNDKIRVLLSEEEVAKRIKEMGDVISSDYEGRQRLPHGTDSPP